MSAAGQVEAYRQFAAAVAEHLTVVFALHGYERGTGKEARAVLRAIHEELRTLRRAVEFPNPDQPDTGLREEEETHG